MPPHRDSSRARRLTGRGLWVVIAAAATVPILLAAFSPYLAYRGPAYVIGGFAGIVALVIMMIQPILPAGYLSGVSRPSGRMVHRWTGMTLVGCVALHVGGLYITSPPDTIDALLLVSPTPFSIYGVTAMWAIVVTALLVVLRGRLPLGVRAWRRWHNALAVIAVIATVVHALQIEGAMEPISKRVLSAAVLLATASAVLDLRVIRPLLSRRG